MLKTLQKFEERVSNIEAKLLIFVVVTMLLMAVYNVLYRNILVPIQTSSNEAHEKEVRAERLKNPPPKTETPTKKAIVKPAEDDGFGGGFGDDSAEEDEGFGGGFGDDKKEDKPPKVDLEEETEEGFAGGFGSDSEDDDDADEDEEDEEGFGGGFGSDSDDSADDEETGFGGGFGSEPTPKKNKVAKSKIEDLPYIPIPKTGLSNIIDAMKLHWIDILLRHLVLVVGFLGAMLATRRRKHITVDALSKVLSPAMNAKIGILTNLLSMTVCLLLANAGKNLVLIGLKFPKEIMWWANESTMQLVFPIGFGLLAAHFSIRVIENIYAVKTGDFSIIESEEIPSLVGGPVTGPTPDAEEEE